MITQCAANYLRILSNVPSVCAYVHHQCSIVLTNKNENTPFVACVCVCLSVCVGSDLHSLPLEVLVYLKALLWNQFQVNAAVDFQE